MVVLNRIYTRTGDGGDTALGTGERVPKESLRVEAYGSVDELNAAVGLARLAADPEADALLAAVQNDLFDLGADLCRPQQAGEDAAERPPLRIAESQVGRLEAEIDEMNGKLSPLRSFVLPGGTSLAAALHHCRTTARRAERRAIELSRSEAVSPFALQYLNRLSDWFFVASRAANGNGERDVLWVPGANR